MNTFELKKATNLLMKNIEGWEQRTIAVICERVRLMGELTTYDAKALKNIYDYNGDMAKITKDLAKELGVSISKVQEIYAEQLQHDMNKKQYLYDFKKLEQVPYVSNKKAQSIVKAFAKTTGQSMINLSKTKALYITDIDGISKPFAGVYQNILDKAVNAVSNGSNFNEEMRSVISQLGGGGVRVNYGSGVTRRLDTVVRQNILWGAKQTSTEYDSIMGEELGCDGFEVDYHPHSRPSHEFMGGVMFAKGKARTVKGVNYPSGNTAEKRLSDYGCLHDKFDVILGVSSPTYSKDEIAKLKEDDKKLIEYDGVKKTGYDWKQEQRKLETEIRYKKDEANALKAVGDMQGRREKQSQINRLQAKYDDLSNSTGLQTNHERMEVKGFSKVKATTEKTSAVKNKGLKKSVDSGIIKVLEDKKTNSNSSNVAFDIEQKKTAYLEFLNDVPEKNKNYLEYYAKTTTYTRVDNPRISYGYDENIDEILYNPQHPAFCDFDFNFANTHELSHRIDNLYVNSSTNNSFIDAIKNDTLYRDDRGMAIEAYFNDYENEISPYLSDIVSALSDDSLNVPYHHDAKYWKKENNKQKEIFANIFSLETFNDIESLDYLKKEFPNIYKTYSLLF